MTLFHWLSPDLRYRIIRAGHAVADLAFGKDVGGVGCVIAQLAAKTLHESVDQPGITGFPPNPHLAQKGIIGDDPSRVE